LEMMVVFRFLIVVILKRKVSGRKRKVKLTL
ncbi:lipoprotein Blc, partial [Vibrio cholerae O1 str. Nep-21106]